MSWYDVRLGRLGGRIVAEVTPSIDGDSALQRIIRRYSSQVAVSYILLVLDTHPDRLRVQFLRADAVQAILERGLCMSPRVTDTDRYSTDILFTGTSDETRHTYDCLLRRAGVLDSQAVELQRVRQP
ncbi:MAG TPA: hypothetical protein VLN49_18540 [Gemmatimonadaceae bacterium]|nr:hypothetical protein [Gemmatimonadaceae bacterium]